MNVSKLRHVGRLQYWTTAARAARLKVEDSAFPLRVNAKSFLRDKQGAQGETDVRKADSTKTAIKSALTAGNCSSFLPPAAADQLFRVRSGSRGSAR